MTPGFTVEQRQAIGAYVRQIANEMDCRDWTFELMYDPPPHVGAMAMVKPVYGRKVASVWFMRDFAELSDAKVRHTIVHEIAHLITDQVTSVLENTGEKLLGKQTWVVLWETTKERCELATDHIADIVAPHLPLIDWTVRDEAAGVVWTDTPTEPADPDPADA